MGDLLPGFVGIGAHGGREELNRHAERADRMGISREDRHAGHFSIAMADPAVHHERSGVLDAPHRLPTAASLLQVGLPDFAKGFGVISGAEFFACLFQSHRAESIKKTSHQRRADDGGCLQHRIDRADGGHGEPRLPVTRINHANRQIEIPVGVTTHCAGQVKEASCTLLDQILNRSFLHQSLFCMSSRPRDRPTKVCPVCGRPFQWRKKWKDVWDDVRYCSERCRRQRNRVAMEDASLD